MTVRFIRITDDSTREDIAEAARHLRARQVNESDPIVKAWLSADIDDLLDLMIKQDSVPR
ncbi:hypothetical protein EFK50_07785 [Nocardioides marmoriginsengisoli]|uniref:Uncharacterized protein n=1 Tax=Nocardioides marmoriginsengisoli TaxID=661483 RepID=A0A3N0CJL7_9ACTN|nr:hypothetical protein [Nocardioides marmoriginsengisoli]RNL63635.1 hypothetical protein EFK50_07785 [Nocardioides marmoriginsengisoli]